MAHRQMVRNGDAWVGITDKPIDVVALKKFDPARYGSLSFANPLALDDPRNCQNPVTSVDPTSAARGPPRTGWPGTSTARSARWCAAATAPTRWPTAAATRRGGTAGTGRRQARLRLRLLADRRLPLRLHQRDPPARRGAQRRHPIYDGYIVAVAGGALRRASCRSTSARPPPTRRRPAPAVLQRRRADHPRHVAVGLPVRHRRPPPRQRRAGRPLPPLRDGRRRATRRPTSSTSPRRRRTSSRPASPCRR